MRARGPADALGGEKTRALPECRLRIGMRLDPGVLRASSGWEWVRRQIVRFQIRQTRDIIRKLKKGGYHANTRGWAHEESKNKIREILRLVETSHEAEVCGIYGYGMHVDGSVANQCYVGGVPGAASGITYYAQLLFRGTADDDRGNAIAYVHPVARFMFAEHEVLRALIPEPSSENIVGT